MKVIVFSLLIILSSPVFSDGYTSVGVINSMSSIYQNGGKLEFELYGTWNNIDNCSAADRWIVGRLPSDNDETVKSKYSMLLAAYMAGKTVELYVSGCEVANKPVVAHVYIPNR